MRGLPRPKGFSGRGCVYLAATVEGEALPTMVEMVRKEHGGSKLRVAVSYAAAVTEPEWGITEFVASTFDKDELGFFDVVSEGDTSSLRAAESLVATADLVLLGPGCPLLVARRFHASGAFTWLARALERGASVVGVSAGAIALCEAWAEWPDPLRADEAFDGGRLIPCGGLVPGVIDCHDERDQWGELEFVAGLLRARGIEPERILGIPTGSGLIVTSTGELTVLGEVFDALVPRRAVA